MADFFKKEEKEVEEVEGKEEEAPVKVKVGEEEYTQEELNDLVSLGKIGKEAEEKYDTKIDKIWPDYGRKSQLLKELEDKEKTREEEAKVALDKKAEAGVELSPEEQKAQLDKQIDTLILNNPGFAKKVGEIFSQQRQGEKLVDKCKGLEGDIDGKDGRPAFKTKDILDHMAETGIRNPQDAYDLKFKDELSKWKEEKISGAKKEGLVTEGAAASGAKEPPKIDINKGNLGKLIKESLYGSG